MEDAVVTDWEAEAKALRQQVVDLQGACGFEEWLCTKHLELRDALEIGDPLIISELTQLLAAGGAKMQAMSGAT